MAKSIQDCEFINYWIALSDCFSNIKSIIADVYNLDDKSLFCSQNYTEGSLKLDTSTDPPLIMMCMQGKWGYVCGGEETDSPWTLENVGVACQQLGYVREGLES